MLYHERIIELCETIQKREKRLKEDSRGDLAYIITYACMLRDGCEPWEVDRLRDKSIDAIRSIYKPRKGNK